LLCSKELLSIIKIDYESWKISNLDSYLSTEAEIVSDQLDSQKFILINKHVFYTASFENDELIFKEYAEFPFLEYVKLVGNELFGFSISLNNNGRRLWKYCEVDLITLIKKVEKVHLSLEEYALDIHVCLRLYI
jgi:hypothetical protein